MSDVFRGNEMSDLPLPWLPRDMWWEIGRFIENPTDWLEFRACCSTFRKVATKRDFGAEGLRGVRKLKGKGHTDCVRCLAVFEGMLVSASNDQTIKFWDVKLGKCLKTLTGNSGWVLCLTVFDSKLISGFTEAIIKVWNSKGECLTTLEGHTDCVRYLVPAFDNEFLASGSDDRTIKVWSKEGLCVKTLVAHSDWVYSLASFRDFLVSGSWDLTIKVWNRDLVRVKLLEDHSDCVLTLLIADDKLFSGSRDYSVKIWDPKEDWKCVQTFNCESCVSSLQVYKNCLYVGLRSGFIEVWNLETNIKVQLVKAHDYLVRSIINFEGRLISASDDTNIIIWDSVYPFQK